MALVTLLAIACGRAPESVRIEREAAPLVPGSGLAFVNRVWVVEESNAVAKGSVRVFLADGTLVLVDPGSTPAFGSWKFEAGKLSIVEEGISYPADLDEVRGALLRITIRGPGEPVRMTLRDARPDWIER